MAKKHKNINFLDAENASITVKENKAFNAVCVVLQYTLVI